MSFPRYLKYKDSGVEWLGEVPEHWKIQPLKFVTTCNDEILPDSTPGDYPLNEDGDAVVLVAAPVVLPDHRGQTIESILQESINL